MVKSSNLQTLTDEQKRLALRALDVQVRVWATDHEPRYRISVSAEGLLPLETPNDLPTEGDDDPVAARVDDCIPSGCAKSG